MPYDSITGRITPPVGLADVAACFGCATDLGTCCTHPAINKWARFKPEAIGTPAELTVLARKGNNFGLRPTTVYNSRTAFVNAVADGSFDGGWEYVRPISGTHWMRLTDFNGYNHRAISPFGILYNQTVTLSSSQFDSTLIAMSVPLATDGQEDSNGYISISEMEGADSYKNWYLGILLYNQTHSFIANTRLPFSQNTDWQVDFGSINPTYADTYIGVPFLSSAPIYVNGHENTDVKIVGIGQEGATVILSTTSATYGITVSAELINSESRTIRYTITLKNNRSDAITFANTILVCAETPSGGNKSTLVTLGKISVAGNSTVTKTGTDTVPSSSQSIFVRVESNLVDSDWTAVDMFPGGPSHED